MLTKKERKILRSIYRIGTKTFSSKDMELYRSLEAQGLIITYYELGHWFAEITDEGVRMLDDSEMVLSLGKVALMILSVIALLFLLCGCEQ